MKIAFNTLERVEGQKPNGDMWVAYKVSGTKLEDGSPWKSNNIFDSKYNKKILEEARALTKGDKIDVKHTKNAQGYWNISGFAPVTDDVAPRAAATTGKGGGMTKADWAAKDQAQRVSIAKSVALKAAIDTFDVTGGQVTTENVIALAKDYEKYLLGIEEEEEMQDPDALEPPEV